MKRKKKTFDEMPRWQEIIKDIGTEYKKEDQERQQEEKILKERLKLPWSFRESSFWLRFRGIKLYDEIKRIYFDKKDKKKAQAFLGQLDNAIDEWDIFVSKKRSVFEGSEKIQSWRKRILERDAHCCKECGDTKDLKVHNIISLSEQIADFIKDAACNINDVDIANTDSFYQIDNGVTLCFRCYDNNDHWGDSQIDMHRMRISETYIETKNRQKEWFKLGDIHTEISNKLKDPTFDSREWFLGKLNEVRELQNEIAYSSHEPASGNRLLEAQLLFRVGEYDLAKRIAIRQEKYWSKETEERENRQLKKEKKRNFAQRNREAVLIKLMDKIIELYKKSDYSIVYRGFPSPFGDEAEWKKYQAVFKEAENEVRKEMGIPLIGEGWIAETEVFYMVKDILSEYEVIHHARPKWLEGQEFDIYIPELNLAIEYMGEQHYKPVDYFGGEEAFMKIVDYDKRKKEKSTRNGVKLLYIKFDEAIDTDILKKNILTVLKT